MPRMVRGRPSGLKAASHRLRRRPDGRPWPRSLCGPSAAGTQGPGQRPAPGCARHPGTGRQSVW